MSSHHFVKEDQEPLLLIGEGECSLEFAGSFLEWNPKVAVIGNAFKKAVIDWRIGIDIWLRPDDMALKGERANYPDLVQIGSPSDFKIILSLVKPFARSGINLIGAGSPHLGDLVNEKLVLWTEETKLFPVTEHFGKFYYAGSRISFEFLQNQLLVGGPGSFERKIQAPGEIIIPADGFYEFTSPESFWLKEFL